MSIPRFRICDRCSADGVEKRIGTADAPMVQITVGVIDGGLSYDATLPRWAWRLWTKFDAKNKSGDDGQPGELEPVPIRHELCQECAEEMLTAPDAHQPQTQRQYRDERRVEHARAEAAEAAAKAAALESRRSPVAP